MMADLMGSFSYIGWLSSVLIGHLRRSRRRDRFDTSSPAGIRAFGSCRPACAEMPLTRLLEEKGSECGR